MPWVKLDDQFPDHLKIVEAGPMASWLYVCGLCYCARQLTDGYIPRGQLRKLADIDDIAPLVTALLTAGLWEECDGGYRVHDYHEYNPTAEQVKAQRRANAERQARFRDKQRDSHDDTSMEEPANGVCSVASNGVTNDVSADTPYPSPYPIPHTPNPAEENVAPAARARDRGWEILSEFCGYEPRDPSERKLRNKVLNHLRVELRATDEEIEQACTNYVERWPEMERTAPAIAKHYERMLREPARASPAGRTKQGVRNGIGLMHELEEQARHERHRSQETDRGHRGDVPGLTAG